jgi:hypothetical protein
MCVAVKAAEAVAMASVEAGSVEAPSFEVVAGAALQRVPRDHKSTLSKYNQKAVRNRKLMLFLPIRILQLRRNSRRRLNYSGKLPSHSEDSQHSRKAIMNQATNNELSVRRL